MLDEQYIVFSVIGKREYFPRDLTRMRREISESIASALQGFRVPAEYYAPDYVIVRNPAIQVLGNAAQIIRQHAVAMHGSVRYSLSEKNLTRMLETLMINGNFLVPHRDEVKKVLGYVIQFTNVGKDRVKNTILQRLIELYGFQRYQLDGLSETEEKEIRALKPIPLEDRPGFRSRGVCHLNLNGKCLISELNDLV